MPDSIDDTEFDQALVGSAFALAARSGWDRLTIAEAAREAGLPLARARARFPGRGAMLLRFGLLADQAALAGGGAEPEPRERLFDMLMGRFDTLQQHRDGVRALLHALPANPGTSLLLYGATLRSMRWLLDAAGVPTARLVGTLRVQGLLAIWLGALRAWDADTSSDLSNTMAAVDRGLGQAVRAEGWLPGGFGSPREDAGGLTPEQCMADALAGAPVEDLTGAIPVSGARSDGEPRLPDVTPPPNMV